MTLQNGDTNIVDHKGFGEGNQGVTLAKRLASPRRSVRDEASRFVYA